MNVLLAAAEVAPLVKTGGLADVVGALPAPLARAGVSARLLLPGVQAILDDLVAPRLLCRLQTPWGGPPVELLAGALQTLDGLPAYVLRSAALYQRPGGLYADPGGKAWADNHRRFAPLGWAALALAQGADAAWRPRVVHAHDWHAGLAPACLAQAGGVAASVLTLHNLAYQGLFPAQTFVDLKLPAAAWAVEGVEFWGQVSFMKAGLQFADVISTVSPTYAREVLTPEHGCGLDGVLRAHAGGVTGILNGVDYRIWNPATDTHLAQTYDAQHMQGKSACKAALQMEHGLDPMAAGPLFGVVSRLTEQKGLNRVLESLPALLAIGGQLLVLGLGDAELEQGFAQAQADHPGRVVLCRAHDEALAHRVFAGADVLLVPSRFEPCGLTQLYAMAYGTLPLVHHVGGLADTVRDASLEALDDDTATGFAFHGLAAQPYEAALRRAAVLWRRPDGWRQVQRRGMAQRFDWDRAARDYLKLYERAATLA